MEGKILSCASVSFKGVSCYRLQFEYGGKVDHAYVGAFDPANLPANDEVLALLWTSPTAVISVQPKDAAEPVELVCPDQIKVGMGWPVKAH